MLGIWGFDLIPFPIPISSPCDTYNSLVGKSFLSEGHFIRINDNNCIITISGFEIIYFLTLRFLGTFIELINGNFTAVQFPDLIALPSIFLIILPFFSNLLLLSNQSSRRLQIINVIVWALSCLPALGVFLYPTNTDELIKYYYKYFYLLWGLWLYILLAFGVIVFEILVLKSENKSSTVI
jgi:hypothetical protein